MSLNTGSGPPLFSQLFNINPAASSSRDLSEQPHGVIALLLPHSLSSPLFPGWLFISPSSTLPFDDNWFTAWICGLSDTFAHGYRLECTTAAMGWKTTTTTTENHFMCFRATWTVKLKTGLVIWTTVVFQVHKHKNIVEPRGSNASLQLFGQCHLLHKGKQEQRESCVKI